MIPRNNETAPSSEEDGAFVCWFREFWLDPDQVPPQLMIADRFSVLRAEVKIQRSGSLWLVAGSTSPVPAHEPFAEPMAAFRWWVADVGGRP